MLHIITIFYFLYYIVTCNGSDYRQGWIYNWIYWILSQLHTITAESLRTLTVSQLIPLWTFSRLMTLLPLKTIVIYSLGSEPKANIHCCVSPLLPWEQTAKKAQVFHCLSVRPTACTAQYFIVTYLYNVVYILVTFLCYI
jgi:hypothetical protein